MDERLTGGMPAAKARINIQWSRGPESKGSLIYPRSVPLADAGVHPAPRINSHVSAPLVFTGIFSEEECAEVGRLAARCRRRVGRMMYAVPNVRKSTIAWVDMQADSEWLYAKVWQTFLAVNRWFEFELAGLVDELQFATYGTGDRFDWHLDAGGAQTSTRKISLSVQLSDEADYLGGDLEFAACPQLDPHRRRGTVIAFPSFLAHQVTPVTCGNRCSLVAWAHGPPFR